MTLNLNNGDFTPHIRWMASTSSWKISTDDGHQPVTWKQAIFDLGNIQTGWGIFNKGEAPEWIMDSSLTQKAPRPQDGREWKRGFKLSLFSESAFGGVREFATTATGACRRPRSPIRGEPVWRPSCTRLRPRIFISSPTAAVATSSRRPSKSTIGTSGVGARSNVKADKTWLFRGSVARDPGGQGDRQ